MKHLLSAALLSLAVLSASAQSQMTYSDGVLTVNGVRYEFALVEGGTFTMGATPEMGEAQNDERPAHEVTLTRDYYVSKTEVTQALWRAVMGTNPSDFPGDRHPVEHISWNDCQKFLARLNAATGKQFRLPTEAEWEFAARGGIKSRDYRFSGNDNLSLVAWNASNSGHTTHDVASKLPNELGIYDMAGNVMELCADRYGAYSGEAQTDPVGPASGKERVGRGGSWNSDAKACRTSNRRYSYHPDSRSLMLGFRLVITADRTLPKKAFSEADVRYSNGVLTVDGIRYEMVKVAAGTFTMGAHSEVQNPEEAETPAHKVKLTVPFYLGRTEVTQALWRAVMGTNPSWFEGTERPVEGVSWNDCQKFLARLNAATGKQFRLPTEAEWEYAARGGKKSRGYQYSGSSSPDDVAWYESNSLGTTHDVATKQANELGLYDMSGNVAEWCADWFAPYDSNAQTNPAGPADGTNRVRRGGSYRYEETNCRSSYRDGCPDGRYATLGFRLALSE